MKAHPVVANISRDIHASDQNKKQPMEKPCGQIPNANILKTCLGGHQRPLSSKKTATFKVRKLSVAQTHSIFNF
jgi:hypothetical protein